MGDLHRIETFIDAFTPLAVRHEPIPFKLRSGVASNWYVDSRAGLSEGQLLSEAAQLLIESTRDRQYKYDVVAGMGIAGTALANAIKVAEGIPGVEGNDDESLGQRYGYGLHGASVENQRVWMVDDVAMTGSSLIKLLDMIRGAGGEVDQAYA